MNGMVFWNKFENICGIYERVLSHDSVCIDASRAERVRRIAQKSNREIYQDVHPYVWTF